MEEQEEVPVEAEVERSKGLRSVNHWLLIILILVVSILTLSQNLVKFKVEIYPHKDSYSNEIVEIDIKPAYLIFHLNTLNGKKLEAKRNNNKLQLFIEVKRDAVVTFLSVFPFKFFRVEIPYLETYTDRNENGFPDVLELDKEDSENFRRWFLEIAKSQFAKKSVLWKERDCAGLVRFAYKEALKKHDDTWEKKIDFIPLTNEQKFDVKKYNYPDVPVVGVKIFKISDSEFGVFADAYHLLKYNVEFVSKDFSKAKAGDILFFYHPSSIDMPYHSMIYTGDGVLYHTGPIDSSSNNEGELRYIRLDDLLKNFPIDWQPLPSNNKFLGFFRFKILSD